MNMVLRLALILFGLLDGVVLIRVLSDTFRTIWETTVFYKENLFLLPFGLRTSFLFILSLFPTSIGFILKKKWAFIISYFQFPFRIAFATFTFFFLFYLGGYFSADHGNSTQILLSGLASLLEIGRLGVTVMAHRRLNKSGTLKRLQPLSVRRKVVAFTGASLAIAIVGLASHCLLTGRFYGSVHTAIRFWDYAAVRSIISRDPDQVNRKDKEGETPLYVAVTWAAHLSYATYFAQAEERQDKIFEIVEFLLKSGADPNIGRNVIGETPLYRAAGNPELTELLLDYGADLSHKDKFEVTPLHHAAMIGSLDVVKILIERRANVNARDRDGETPLAKAMENGHSEVVDFLIQSGAGAEAVELKNNEGIILE